MSNKKNSNESDKKVEWLYSGNNIDRNAYLLGKPIDKRLIEEEIDTDKKEPIVNVIDLAAKIREDPLFEIKKKEIEAKKKLLENPLLLKQLSRNINMPQRQRTNQSDSSEDESRERKNHKKKSKNRVNNKKSRSRSRSRSKDREHNHRAGYGLIKRRETDERSHRSDTKSEKQLEIEKLKRDIERMKNKRLEKDDQIKQDPFQKKRLTENEKQDRLAKMQENARWREDVRSSNIESYKMEREREKKLHEESVSKKSRSDASHLFNNIMHDAYSSKEDRIKRNIKNIQHND